MAAKLTRRNSYTGMPVAIHTANGDRVEGSLVAWGASVIRVTEFGTGKWREFSRGIVFAVEALAS